MGINMGMGECSEDQREGSATEAHRLGPRGRARKKNIILSKESATIRIPCLIFLSSP